VDRMTPHNWHNFLRCHGQAAEHGHRIETGEARGTPASGDW
jgi:hypothetical protein